MNIDLTGADARSTKELTTTLDELMKAWPGVEPSDVILYPFDGEDEEGTMGDTDMETKRLRISSVYAADFDKWHHDLGKAIQERFIHPGVAGHPARYTMTHEFGHVLCAVVIGRLDLHDDSGDEQMRRLIIDAWTVAEPDAKDVSPDNLPMFWSLGMLREDVEKGLSKYASTSPHELLAEAFAIHTILGPGVSAMADKVMEELTALHRAKFPQKVAA